MNSAIARRQGQPILFLGLLVAGWFLLRLMTWESPIAPAPLFAEPLRLAEEIESGAPKEVQAPAVADPAANEPTALVFAPRHLPLPSPHSAILRPPAHDALPAPALPSEAFDPHRRAVGHTLLFAAGMASLPLPREVARLLDEDQSRSAGDPEHASKPPRWRFDSWALLREGGIQLTAAGTRPASYGASQIGAVLAYRLSPSSGRDPAAYLRASEALVAGGEREAALGLRARLLAGVPLSLHVEARVTDRPGGTELRPAAFLAGGFDDVRLPAGVRARGYGQAGYVHGDFATAFADGKVVAEREVARFDLGKASIGVGAWGGAQKGAHRLDLGPTVSLDIRLGETPARIEADYRWRLAGNAEPGSGGVLTLSTGF